MGQWGAFGYAAQYHRDYQWILAHYYGKTVLSTAHNAASSDPIISVAITENDAEPVVVTSPSAFTFGGAKVKLPAGEAAKAVLSAAKGTWTVSEASGCGAAKWTTVATGLTDPVAVPASLAPGAGANRLLTLCEADGTDMTVRGSIEAYDRGASMRTLSLLPLELYLRAVVPAEMPYTWGLVGGTSGAPSGQQWGYQALEAQAVAARTYTMAYIAAGGWYGYADICDSDCQSYDGLTDESLLSDAAIAATAGDILLSDGQPAETEYSASTGGYTFGGAFPAVVDRGDAVCIKSQYYTCNPNHDWTESVPVSAVDSAFASIGKLVAIDVTKRNGLGAEGGRVLALQVVGTRATVTLGGDGVDGGAELAADLGLNSDWFEVTNGP